MRSDEKSMKNSVGRMVFVGISVLLQAGWILLLILRLNEYSVYISLLTSVLTMLLVLRLYNTKIPMGFKLLWIMIILAFPVLGISLYMMIGRSAITKGMRLRLEKIDEGLSSWLKQY